MDNVCNRCLFSIPSKVEMAEEQEYFQCLLFDVAFCFHVHYTHAHDVPGVFRSVFKAMVFHGHISH